MGGLRRGTVRFLVILVAIHLTDSQGTENACCNTGKWHGMASQPCDRVPDHLERKTGPGFEDCGLNFRSCCTKEVKKLLCNFGIARGRNGGECSSLPTEPHPSLVTKECCISCKKGIERARNGSSCRDLDHSLNNFLIETMINCCEPEAATLASEKARQVKEESTRPVSGSEVSPGSDYRCPTGYKNDPKNPRLCIDVDECSLTNVDCGKEEECRNLDGGYKCIKKQNPESRWKAMFFGSSSRTEEERQEETCGNGLRKDGEDCVDIDECRIGSHACDLTKFDCINKEGDYECVLRETTTSTTEPSHVFFFPERGPTPQRGLADDEDEDESTPSPDSRGTGSSNSRGTGSSNSRGTGSSDSRGTEAEIVFFSTTRRPIQLYTPPLRKLPPGVEDEICDRGFEYSNETKECEDINECDLKPNLCPSDSECINTMGSFTCECIKSGFELINNICQDIDECSKDGAQKLCPYNTQCTNTYGSFICSCPSGHVINLKTKYCEDENECITGNHACNSGERCENTIGSYKCIRIAPCGSGYIFDTSINNCIDIDECKTNDPCPKELPGSTCMNTRGSYRCLLSSTSSSNTGNSKPTTLITTDNTIESKDCDSGFVWNSITSKCEDIDECVHLNPCPENRICHNFVGTYSCLPKPCLFGQVKLPNGTCIIPNCGIGYTWNSTLSTCYDIDECLEGSHDCRKMETCQNRVGYFVCESKQCPPGWTLNWNNDDCVDIDECSLGFHNCDRSSQRCINTIGSYSCHCAKGYQRVIPGAIRSSNNLELFEDDILVSESDLERGKSDLRQESGESGLRKESGESDLRRDRRSPIESVSGGVGVLDAGEDVAIGKGFESRLKCIDVDECSLYTLSETCGSESMKCMNTIGSFECICKDGFERNNGREMCKDINECVHGIQGQLGLNIPPCDENVSKCVNTYGGYKCVCKIGYKPSESEGECVDIDECEHDEMIKDGKISRKNKFCQGDCFNTIGSYKCACPPGYKVDGALCIDLNECEGEGLEEIAGTELSSDLNVSKSKSNNSSKLCPDICLNTPGNYSCFVINCEPGYYRKKDEDRTYCIRDETTLPCGGPSQESCLLTPKFYLYGYVSILSNIPIDEPGSYQNYQPPGGGFVAFAIEGESEYDYIKVSIDSFDTIIREDKPDVDRLLKDDVAVTRFDKNSYDFVIKKSITGPQTVIVGFDVKSFKGNALNGVHKQVVFIEVSENEF